MIENDFIKFKYENFHELGKGSFGKAFVCNDKNNLEKVVIKEINLAKFGNLSKNVIQEGPILYQLSHPNIIKFHQFFFDNSKAYLIMQYADGGDLNKKINEKIRNNENFEETQILCWFSELCSAIKCCHDNNIMHRDIKPKNIFLTKNNQIKLGDFGVAKLLNPKNIITDTFMGTLDYMPPEALERKPYTFSFDIWSLGIVLYELCFLHVPTELEFDENGSLSFIENENFSKKVYDLIKTILKKNPNERPVIDKLIRICNSISERKNNSSDSDEPSSSMICNSISERKNNSSDSDEPSSSMIEKIDEFILTNLIGKLISNISWGSGDNKLIREDEKKINI